MNVDVGLYIKINIKKKIKKKKKTIIHMKMLNKPFVDSLSMIVDYIFNYELIKYIICDITNSSSCHLHIIKKFM